jgi:hypothetical protein
LCCLWCGGGWGGVLGLRVYRRLLCRLLGIIDGLEKSLVGLVGEDGWLKEKGASLDVKGSLATSKNKQEVETYIGSVQRHHQPKWIDTSKRHLYPTTLCTYTTIIQPSTYLPKPSLYPSNTECCNSTPN